jgi:hypothetical protein
MYTVFSVQLADTTSYGISSEDYLAKIALDALQETPKTSIGRCIAAQGGTLKKESRMSSYSVAVKILHDLDPKAYPWDVDVACTTPVTTWPHKTHDIPGELVLSAAWFTEDGTTSTLRTFFRTGCPCDLEFITRNTDIILNGETFAEVVSSFFYTMLVRPKSHPGYGAMYNPSIRKMVMRTTSSPWFQEMSSVEFRKMLVPWVGRTLLQLCYHLLAGSREQQNPRLDLEGLKKRATEILTLAYTEDILGYLLMDKKDMKPISLTCVEMMMEYIKDPQYINSLCEKKRTLYPRDHPQHPGYVKYSKEINKQKAHTHHEIYGVSIHDTPILDTGLLKHSRRHTKAEENRDLKELEFYVKEVNKYHTS